MALMAPVGPVIGRAFGRRRALLGSTALIGSATALRTEGSLVILFASAFAVGIGIATVQTITPEIIKRNFPEKAALVTGAYTASMAVGATLAAGTVVPVSAVLGSWQTALAVWGAPAVLAVAVWLPLIRRRKSQSEAVTGRSLPLDSRRVWTVVAVFSVTSLVYFSLVSWIAPLYQDAGLEAARAGVMLSVFTGVQIISAFIVPAVINRFPDRRPWLVGIIAAMVATLVMISLAPAEQPWMPWAWTGLLGLSQGALFPLSLTLPLDNSATPEVAGKLTATVFLVGYTLAAIGPAAIGAARDLTGGFAAPFLALAALGCLQLVLALRLTPGITVDRP